MFSRGRQYEAPWPDDALLGDFGIRLAYQDRNSTQLVELIPDDQGAVAPGQFGEQARNPVFGGTLAIRDLTRGYGRPRLRGDHDGRYDYALNVDVSAGAWMKGPAVTTFTPATRDSTNGITRGLDFDGKLFLLNGRYMLDRGAAGSTDSVSRDFGSGKAGIDAIVTQAAGGTRYIFVAMGDSELLWHYDASNWTQHATMYARAFAIGATLFYRVDDRNRVNVCDLASDPTVAANWSDPYERVGSYDWSVTRLEVNQAGSLIAYKGDDIYTLDEEGRWHRLFARQEFIPAATNGEALGAWRNDSYVVYGRSLHRLTPDGGLSDPIGPEAIGENDSPVKGVGTALAGTDFGLYLGLVNPDTGNSYLLKHAGELTQDQYDKTIPVWHGSITAAFASKKIYLLKASTRGADSGHERLYIGFSDGTGAYIQLPCTANPAACSNYDFSLADGTLYLGRHHFYFAGEPKTFLAAVGEGDVLTVDAYAQLAWKVTEGGNYATLTPDYNSAEVKSVDFPDYTAGAFLDALVTLVSAVPEITPKVTGFSFLWQLRSKQPSAFSANIIAEDNQRQRDGTPYRHGAREIEDYVRYLARAPWGVPFTEPDGTARIVTVRSPEIRTAWTGAYAKIRQPRKAIRVVLTETRRIDATLPIDGQWAWYKADVGTGGVSNGDPITTWPDQSGNGRNLTNSGGGVRPGYYTNRQNSLPGILLDGTDDYLSCTFTAQAQPFEIWLACKIVGYNADDPVIWTGADASSGFRILQGTPNSLIPHAGSAGTANAALPYGTWGILRAVVNGASSVLILNNLAYVASGNISTGTMAGIRLGSAPGGSAFATVEYGEVIAYSRVLTEAEAQQNWSYLNGRWGVF